MLNNKHFIAQFMKEYKKLYTEEKSKSLQSDTPDVNNNNNNNGGEEFLSFLPDLLWNEFMLHTFPRWAQLLVSAVPTPDLNASSPLSERDNEHGNPSHKEEEEVVVTVAAAASTPSSSSSSIYLNNEYPLSLFEEIGFPLQPFGMSSSSSFTSWRGKVNPNTMINYYYPNYKEKSPFLLTSYFKDTKQEDEEEKEERRGNSILGRVLKRSLIDTHLFSSINDNNNKEDKQTMIDALVSQSQLSPLHGLWVEWLLLFYSYAPSPPFASGEEDHSPKDTKDLFKERLNYFTECWRDVVYRIAYNNPNHNNNKENQPKKVDLKSFTQSVVECLSLPEEKEDETNDGDNNNGATKKKIEAVELYAVLLARSLFYELLYLQQGGDEHSFENNFLFLDTNNNKNNNCIIRTVGEYLTHQITECIPTITASSLSSPPDNNNNNNNNNCIIRSFRVGMLYGDGVQSPSTLKGPEKGKPSSSNNNNNNNNQRKKNRRRRDEDDEEEDDEEEEEEEWYEQLPKETSETNKMKNPPQNNNYSLKRKKETPKRQFEVAHVVLDVYRSEELTSRSPNHNNNVLHYYNNTLEREYVIKKGSVEW